MNLTPPPLSLSPSVCLTLSMSLGQIVADIYEAQGLAFVEVSATFLNNELLPLVKKTVTDIKVRGGSKIKHVLSELTIFPFYQILLSVRRTFLSRQRWSSRRSVQDVKAP